ncbi:oxygenase MpaB family protein [Aquipuribacter sp. MA13-6]|uniref:oxygenase MpaB family protein n=1 Tax=unclassified Aquipuribacter TaxID=2635084 RepID=UPI003EEC4C22
MTVDPSPAGAPTPPAPRDPGLFGPGSVTWQLHADPLVALAGLRALLLQSLHPVVAHGFATHSDYQRQPWSRLLRTADFMAVTTFGSTSEVHAAAARVRRAHAGSPFVDPGDGSRRRIDEPALLLWVHACLLDSVLAVTRRGGVRLSGPESDRYVAEQVRSVALLGVHPRAAPRTTAELAAYLERVRPSLRLSDPARDAVRLVLAPPIHPLLELLTPARVGWSSLAGVAFATLPDWARDLFPPPGTADASMPEAAVTASLRALRRTGIGVGTMAPALARSPHERAARRRLRTA